jgi:competence protein ComEC
MGNHAWGPWLLWPAAWLLGLALPGFASELAPAWGHLAGLWLGTGGLFAALWLVRPQWHLPMHLALGLGAAACVAAGWGWAGWRAAGAMGERLPAAWVDHNLLIDFEVSSLATPVQGGWRIEARVLRWHGLSGAGAAPGAPMPQPACLPGRVALTLTGWPAEPLAGERWRAVVRLHRPDGLSNPGGSDAGASRLSHGVRAVGRVVNSRKVMRPVPLAGPAWYEPARWETSVARLRAGIRSRLQARVNDPAVAGVLAGLSIGDQAAVASVDWAAFRRTGLAHLLAVSGAHIVMLGWFVAGLVRRLWARSSTGVHRWPAHVVARWAGLLACMGYAALSGWGLPAQRTVWMMAAFAGLRTSGLRWPWPMVWLWSAALVALLDPWALWQAGFWLSYVAVGVLMAFPSDAPARGGPADREQPGWRASLSNMLRVQARLTLALAPLSLVCFQQVSVVGLLANLVAIPVATVVVTPLALLGIVFPAAWTLDAWVLSPCLAGLRTLAIWPGATWGVAQAPVWLALGVVLAGATLALPMPLRWRGLAVPWLAAMVWLPPSWHRVAPPAPGHFVLVAADVGQGTAVLVQTARHQLLFDTGPRWGPDADAGQRVLLPLLQSLDQGPIDLLMISHEDTDHVGGAASVVAGWPVRALMSSLPADHPLRALPGRQGRPLPHRPCVAGTRWVWDDVHFEVLHPLVDAPLADDPATASERGSPNAHSCVLRVSEASAQPVPASVLIAADIEAAQEADLVAWAQAAGESLRSTVLIAPHHGSQTSSTTPLLQAIEPAQVVIQVARRNRYGHPAPEVLARYDELGLPWVGSPDCGAYIWDSSEHEARGQAAARVGARVGQCWRRTHPRYWSDDLSDASS